jgi:hypothetical protein
MPVRLLSPVRSLIAGLLLVAAGVAGLAAEPDTTRAQLRQLDQLERILQMEPQQLEALRMTITRVEKMSEEEKARLRRSIAGLRALPAQERSETVESLKDLTPRERRLLRRHWLEMDEKERDAERERLRELSTEERAAYWDKVLKREPAS